MLSEFEKLSNKILGIQQPKNSSLKAKKEKEKPPMAVSYSQGGIFIHGKGGWYNVLSGYHLFVKYQTEDENENYTWILELVPSNQDKEQENIYIEVSHEQFCSARDLYKVLATRLITIKLSDEALKNLQEYIFTQTTFHKARKINRFGYDAESKLFFFSNLAVANGKEHYIPNEFSMIEAGEKAYSMPEKTKKTSHFYEYKKSEIDFNEFYRLFCDIHTEEIAFLSVSFYLMSLFRDIILRHTKASPILFLKGGAGTGKSSIARAISALFGNVPKANLKNRNTEPALVKLMSQASNTVIWFDEYHNEFAFEGLLQAAYDNDGYHRSSDSNTSKTNSVDIYSALMLTSNYVPENPVFFSRCIFVPVPVPQKSDRQRNLFATLEKHIETGISSITESILEHRTIIENQFGEYYTHINSILKQIAKTKEENIDERFFTNMASVLTPISVLACHDKIQICEYTSQDKGHLMDYVCEIGFKYLSRHYKMMNEASALAKFFELLNTMHERFILHEDVHFKFGTGEYQGQIALRFGKVYTLFAEQYRKLHYTAPPRKEDLKQEIMNFLQLKEWKEKNTKMLPDHNSNEKESCNVIWLEYEKLQKTYELELHKRKSIKNF